MQGGLCNEYVDGRERERDHAGGRRGGRRDPRVRAPRPGLVAPGAGAGERDGGRQYQPAPSARLRQLGPGDRPADRRPADAARPAAARGRARAARDRRIRDAQPGGDAVDQDYHREPEPLEAGARRAQPRRVTRRRPTRFRAR